MMRLGFAKLFAAAEINLDAQNTEDLVLFPEMDLQSPLPPVTARALAQRRQSAPLMCETSRMVVQRKGVPGLSFTPCTLLPDRHLSDVLADSAHPVQLDHHHCGQFCVFGGASCAG